MKNRKVHNSSTPGCFVNLFDINLMDKPHYHGPLRSRSRFDGAISPIEYPLEDKLITSEQRRNVSDRTPMKMLIEHEMSKEELMGNPPNLVAKLMGLDALPRQHTDSVPHRCQSKTHGSSIDIYFDKPHGYRHTDTGVSNKQCKYEANYSKHKDYKDVYDILMHAHGHKVVKDVARQKSSHGKDIDEKQMAIVRQVFVKAKQLVTDEKLRQSKEFQDALEVLSSNRGYFLKCLQETNSLFTQQMYRNYTIPETPETKRITVLKPSRIEENEKFAVSENKHEKHAKKPVPVALTHGRSKSNDECSSTFYHWNSDDNVPTRIVVLKPSIVNAGGIGTMGSTEGKDYFNEATDFNSTEAREVAKDITRQMYDKLMGRQSDETLFSSVFSNGYTGDESYTNKSDNEYDRESASEAMSPTLRHSWDYINRFSSAFESSSFSRASCSPESSVCREAKKRLSERWAMVALNVNPPENREVIRRSSTLGEMLSLSDKRSQASEEVESQETRRSTTSYELAKEEILVDPLRSLTRSKSVPLSSSVYGDRLSVELSCPEECKPEEPRDVKTKRTKISFKGKLSSLFFSKNKKVEKVASNAPEAENLTHVSTLGTSEHFIENNNCSTPMLIGEFFPKESIYFSLQGSNQDVASSKVGLPVWRTANSNDNQDQPSPVSVLETPFVENGNMALEFTNCKQDQGSRILGHQLKSCLIDKSPPIGSISRMISSKDSCSSDIAAMFPIANSVAPLESESEEDWFQFVQTLLADSGLSDAVHSEALSTRWHSTDSPLDPLLREKYVNLNKNTIANEANHRQWRSSCNLMYDCVNAALADITYSRKTESKHKRQNPNSLSFEVHNQTPFIDEVWTKIMEWINYDARSFVGGDGDRKNRLLVESVVKKEVAGKGWVENAHVEINEVGEGIEEKLLEELVEDAVVAALAGRYL